MNMTWVGIYCTCKRHLYMILDKRRGKTYTLPESARRQPETGDTWKHFPFAYAWTFV